MEAPRKLELKKEKPAGAAGALLYRSSIEKGK
jgi:hypothetical protein